MALGRGGAGGPSAPRRLCASGHGSSGAAPGHGSAADTGRSGFPAADTAAAPAAQRAGGVAGWGRARRAVRRSAATSASGAAEAGNRRACTSRARTAPDHRRRAGTQSDARPRSGRAGDGQRRGQRFRRRSWRRRRPSAHHPGAYGRRTADPAPARGLPSAHGRAGDPGLPRAAGHHSERLPPGGRNAARDGIRRGGSCGRSIFPLSSSDAERSAD